MLSMLFFTGREVDYMSDESSDSEDELLEVNIHPHPPKNKKVFFLFIATKLYFFKNNDDNRRDKTKCINYWWKSLDTTNLY